MNYFGQIYYTTGTAPDFSVNEAVITRSRLSIDWLEGDYEGHLEAKSRNGRNDRGAYCYPTLNPLCECDIALFRCGKEVLLFGTSCDHENAEEGVWTIRLTPGKKPAARTVVSRGKLPSRTNKAAKSDPPVQRKGSRRSALPGQVERVPVSNTQSIKDGRSMNHMPRVIADELITCSETKAVLLTQADLSSKLQALRPVDLDRITKQAQCHRIRHEALRHLRALMEQG